MIAENPTNSPLDKFGGSFTRWFEDWASRNIVAPKGHNLCEECGGTGSIGTEQRYTDPTYDGSETQWRGYLPTNFCHVCDGTGLWPPLGGRSR
jgi:hypothetical protein